MGETYQVAMTLDAYNVIMQMTTVKQPLVFLQTMCPLSRVTFQIPISCRLRRRAREGKRNLGPLHTVPQTAFPKPRQEDCCPPAPSAEELPPLCIVKVKPLSRLALSYPRSQRQYACYRVTTLRSSRY